MTAGALPDAPPHPSAFFDDERTFGQKLADRVAEHIGSWRFLIIQTVVVSLWVVINLVLLVRWRWDPYPFILLNLLFSVQAAYTGPVLLLSQNRAAERDRLIVERDAQVNEKAEQLVEALMNEVLRNSKATLAIADCLGVKIGSLEKHEEELDAKLDEVHQQLSEVEDVLSADAQETDKPGRLSAG
jgi:uncharacterized membrane protein